MKKLIILTAALTVVVTTAYAGVDRIRSNGNISGVPSYQITCSSGSTHIVYKKSGTWYTGGSGHMGHKYDSWSTDDVANYLCN